MTRHQLQSLQGKENFLHHFIHNYAEITKGFMYLLKKGVPFIWDDQDQHSFDSLKNRITTTMSIHPPDYMQDYILYLATYTFTIIMVLAQGHDEGQEHVVYYLIKSILHIETHYSHVEKLDLEVFIVIQRFHHYILLHKTTIITDSNPMYHILN